MDNFWNILEKKIPDWLWKLLKVFTSHLVSFIHICWGNYVLVVLLTTSYAQFICDTANFSVLKSVLLLSINSFYLRYFFFCYFSTVAEFIVALGLFIWLVSYGLSAIYEEEKIYCRIEKTDFYYFCTGHSYKFYILICYLTIILLIFYICISSYILIWLKRHSASALKLET